jgi:membrane-bound metal-dependent hydrolase YbcI (DUF457 family)
MRKSKPERRSKQTKSGNFFLYFGPFLKNREMNPAETYFQVLSLSSHASPVGTTPSWVMPCALAWLLEHAHSLLSMWRHVAWVVPSGLARLSRTDCCDVTNSPILSDVDWVAPCMAMRLMKESRQPPWRDSPAEYGSPPFLFLSPLFLSFFLLLYSPCSSSIGDFEFSPQI